MAEPEKIARRQIDAQLVACGWVVQDYKQFDPSARRGIVLREAPLRDALKPLAERISAAFVYGSVAKKKDTAASDIDLMVISRKVTYADLFNVLEEVSTRLGRQVNATVYSPQEMAKRVKQDNAFVTRVLAQPKIWLFGGASDLAA